MVADGPIEAGAARSAPHVRVAIDRSVLATNARTAQSTSLDLKATMREFAVSKTWREDMPRKTTLAALWSIGLAATATPAIAADVTPQRLVNARSEPQNWLMIHHDYDNSRHSSLRRSTATQSKILNSNTHSPSAAAR